MKSHLLFLLLLIFSCKQNEQKELYPEAQIQTKKINNSEEVYLKKFTPEDVAKFTIASIMGQSTKIIKVTQRNNLYHVS